MAPRTSRSADPFLNAWLDPDKNENADKCL
jgi:hypothetical protein